MISYDATIADAVAAGHSYDFVTFDFKVAFNKSPHKFFLRLSDMRMSSMSLHGFLVLSGRSV